MSKSNSNVNKKRKSSFGNDSQSLLVSSTETKLRKRKTRQILSTPTINIISTTTNYTTGNYNNNNNNSDKVTSDNDDKFNFLSSHQQQQQQQSATTGTNDDYDDLLADCLEEMEASIFSSQHSPTSVPNATSSSSSIASINDNSHTTTSSINEDKDDDDNGTKSSDLLWFVPTTTTSRNDRCDTNNQLSSHQCHEQQKQKIDFKNKLLIDKIQTWNHDMIYYSSINSNSSNKKKRNSNHQQQQHYTRVYNYGYFVPSFDVEMTRHFQIESLSKFVLESVSTTVSTAQSSNHVTQLRIPTFERWLLDSKQEEKERGLSVLRNTTTSTLKNTSKSSKSSSVSSSPYTYYDPILPCCNFNQLMTMKATHRLMEEIQQCQQVQQQQQQNQQQGINTTINSNQSREATKQIVQDLCRKTLTAVQTVAQQNNMYTMNQQQLSSSPFRKGDRIILKTTTTTTTPTPKSNINSNISNDNNKIDEGNINNKSGTNEKSTACYYTLEYHRDKKWKKPFSIKINKSHYDKLQCMFLYVHNKYPRNKKVLTPLSFYETSTKTGQEQSTMTLHVFHLLVMVLTIRYSSLSGGQLLFTLRGGGMQGAVHNDLFHVLHDYFVSSSSLSSIQAQVPILRECFASPFNAYLMSSYTSAFFDDIDWHFGSIGNFFTNSSMIPTVGQDNNDQYSNIIVPEEGCYQLNPPFSPGIMTSMANHINTILRKANEQNKALTFVVIVPSVDIGSSHDNVKANESTNNNTVDDETLTSTTQDRTDELTKLVLPASKQRLTKDTVHTTTTGTTSSKDGTKVESIVKRFCTVSFRRLINNEYCTVHIQIPAYEHGYIEGSQHLRPTRYKESSYDTSVIILQSNVAKQQYQQQQQQENNTSTQSTNENKLSSLVSNIRTAFASRHHSELTLRRQNKKTSEVKKVE